MQSRITPKQIPQALADFDNLPDAAHVDVRVVAPLLGCSIPSVWRWARLKKIPSPVAIGEGCTRWNVGSPRTHLARGAA